MILVKQVKTVTGEIQDLSIDSQEEMLIPGQGLLALPAVIDPHVHFRTPGWEYKEDWQTGARAAIRGGCTTVFDMPNTNPATVTRRLLLEKKALIAEQLQKADIPLRYQLFFGADKHHLSELAQVKDEVIGIKVFMGCSTGNLVIDDDASLQAVFERAADLNLIVAVHAEDEHMIRSRKQQFSDRHDYAVHSQIRDPAVAVCAIEKAIELVARYQTRLYILHVSTAAEVALIAAAKQAGLPVYAETTPHHLFLNDGAYATLAGKAVVNPPLRSQDQQAHLLTAIETGVIDTIGSDHAPHTEAEKSAAYGQCPSGMPGIEFMLPLLLNAYHNGLLSMHKLVQLTSARAQTIFGLQQTQDWVLVDVHKTMTIKRTESKCGWSPYEGLTLHGWPIYTILRGHVYQVN